MKKVVHILSEIPCIREYLQRLLPNLKIEEIKLQNVLVGNAASANKDPVVATEMDQVVKGVQQDVEILLADFDLFSPYMYFEWPNLKWVQGTFAGFETLMQYYDVQKPKPSFAVTRYSGDQMGGLIAEYTISQIISHERRFHNLWEDQKALTWDTKASFENYRCVKELIVGILGVGTLGKEIAKILKAFQATVWGLVRQEITPERKSQYVDEYRLIKDIPELLKNCDYICNMLPCTPETRGLLNDNVLRHCEKQPVFINVGRGSIISSKELIHALKKGWLSAAVLDVFEEEPLQKDSPLWTVPQVTITPHVAGVTRPQDISEVFQQNYNRFISGQPLKYLVDWDSEY